MNVSKQIKEKKDNISFESVLPVTLNMSVFLFFSIYFY